MIAGASSGILYDMSKKPAVQETERRIRVLIVDDRSRSRDGLRALLSTWPQVEVIGEAQDGREAVLLVEQWQPHVVLMDARMPGMDGVNATRLIKARWPSTKVIVLTIYAAYRASALAAEADAFLVKGCPAEDLLKAIVNHLNTPLADLTLRLGQGSLAA